MENLFYASNVPKDFTPFQRAAQARGWLNESMTSTDSRIPPFLKISPSAGIYWEFSKITVGDITWNELEPAGRQSLAAQGIRNTFLLEFRTPTLPLLLEFLNAVDVDAKVGLDEEMTIRFWPVSSQTDFLEHFRNRF